MEVVVSDTLAELMHGNLLEVFAQRDPELRREAAARIYTEDVVFSDDEGSVQGRDAVHAKAGAILDGAPGFVFRPDGDVYEAQELGYLAWALGPEGADPVVRGVDMGIVRDGKLARVYTVLLH